MRTHRDGRDDALDGIDELNRVAGPRCASGTIFSKSNEPRPHTMVMDPAQLRETGDWLAELRVLLKADASKRPVGAQTKAKHRSTVKAVKLLIGSLSTEIHDVDGQSAEVKDRLKKAVFNSIDRLIEEKVEKSKRGKTRLQALEKFRDVLEAEYAEAARKAGVPTDTWKLVFHEALRALRQEALEDTYQNGNEPPQEKEALRREMLVTEEGRLAMANNQALAADVLAKVDKDWLNTGGTGARVVQKLWQSGNYDEICKLIGRGVDTSVAARAGPATGGSPKDRQNGDYSGFVQPLQHVIATRLRDIALLDASECSFAKAHAARIEAAACPAADDHRAKRKSVTCSDSDKHEAAIAPTACPQGDAHEALLSNSAGDFTKERQEQARGAKKIFAALGSKAVSITSWEEVQGSDMVDAFKANPGTIWGFEDVRYPYVQAAHETPDGVQPLRMMELWETVELALERFGYEDLLDNPDKAIAKFVAAGVKTIREKAAENNPKYAAIARDLDGFIKKFEKDTAAFLNELAAQMPKGAFGVGKALNEKGKARMDGTLGEVAGMDSSKFMAGMACKAGLWWAKVEGKPVYYCLDGIRMEDVTSYKEMKNKAIEDFINDGGIQAKAAKQSEVITMAEVREILKNWDELRDTIVFVEKGKVLSKTEAEKRVNGTDKKPGWKKQMEEGNQRAGRTPAPPRENFANDLKAIDPTLMGRFPQGPEGDMDARDVVKKTAYLVRVATTRPEIVLKYIMSRCSALVKYGLMPAGLVPAAAALHKAEREKAAATEIKRLGGLLISEIEKCHDKFKAPLKAAMIRHPLLA